MIGTVVQHRLAGRASLKTVKVGGRLTPSAHERKVTTIALRLFDLLSPLHGLDDSYRKLLHIASLVHDCGRRFGAEDHPITGAQLVSNDRTLDLSAAERRCVAYLVRYHSGKVPPMSQSEYLSAQDARRKMRTLLSFLRAADGLDSRRISASAIIIKRKGQKLHIQCWVEHSLDKARDAFTRPKKFALLEELRFGLRVSVRIGQLIGQI